ncbi:hypothetical protein TNIN_21231 [Trichonephila inaurata madagascariensis]|uniref:Uncharacterized protein n=1 Tax=Trichonephila inaurata madagascariensis TaxID=2747483 RepID=A0A8X6Y9T2_9ARAC|nr:hypothetical protein TNIN_21231 [Trichonephila inaurata madagascariensis]
MGDKFRRLARKSFPRTTSSGKVTSLGKKFKNTCLSSDERIRGSSLKTFSQDSIDSKDLGELSRSQSPMGSSISVDKLTLETKSGKSKALSFTTPKPLSPSFRACIKDSSGGFVNPETKDASKSSQIPNISDENRSTKKKERAKESYAKSVTFSAPKKRSPNRSKDNTPGRSRN